MRSDALFHVPSYCGQDFASCEDPESRQGVYTLDLHVNMDKQGMVSRLEDPEYRKGIVGG